MLNITNASFSGDARQSVLSATLERMIYSVYNYWLVLVSDVVAAVVFLVVGVRYMAGSALAAAASVIVGFMAWSLIEYLLHRWLFHGPRSIVRRSHARHHADGAALISTPVVVAMASACAVWMILSMVFPAAIACLLVFGLYAGYNYYALLHHVQHHHRSRLACFAGLERAHRIHHVLHTANYGVTTTLWDRLLGTFARS